MTSTHRPYKSHILVCTNIRPVGGKPSCGIYSSMSLLHKFQLAILKQKELAGNILVTGTSCLGHCFEGPNIVIYPEGVWYQRVQIDDVDELIESHFLQKLPYKRLLADFPSST